MAATKLIRIYDPIYSPMFTPTGCRTAAQWLRDGFRVKGDYYTKLLTLHDRPTGRKRASEESFPPEEVAALRLRLEESEWPSAGDRLLIARMELACQATWCNLYDPGAVVPITEPNQTEAWELLSGLWRSGSHKTEFIFGGVRDDGEKWCFTAGGKIADKTWDIVRHKQGVEYLGIKRGESTRVIDIDLDRHSAAVPAAAHLKTVLDTLRWLQKHMPWVSPHVTNINPRNGSCHITLYLPKAIPVWQARLVVADIRSECPWLQGVEIYPDNCPQFLLPLRRDKVTVIDRVLTPSVKSWRKVELPGQRRKKGRKPQKVRREYLAMDAAAYWQWIDGEERKPCDLALVEEELRKAYRGMPEAAVTSNPRRKCERRAERPGHGRPEGGIRMKGRCARILVDFLKGGEGDARVMSTVMLRAFCGVEDVDRDKAVALTGELLGMRPEFQDRPVGDRPKLSRMIEATADAIWRDNGYQADPLGSLEIWRKVKVAWNRRGFRLSDPSTWDRAGRAVADDRRDIVWSPDTLGLLPGLAEAARCDQDRARKLLRMVCVHVGLKAELSLSFLERIMAEAGIAAYRDNAVRVRRYLEEAGVLVLRRKGFRFGEEAGVGNHYTLGLMIEMACPGREDAPGLVVFPPANPAGEGTSTYPSLGRLDVRPLVERRRLERCLNHYYERVRAVGGGFRDAA